MKKGIKRIVTAALAAVLMVTQLPVMNSKAAAGISIYGKAHVQTYGDTNGKIVKENGIDTLVLGTRGEAKRVESMTINLQNESGYTGTIQYRVHRQTYGWETRWAKDGSVSGTTGQAKRLEAISIDARSSYNGSVEYQTHVQTYGWMDWVSDGTLSGTSGQAKRLEAIRIRLTGELAQHYDIYYRVHAQTFGWMGWAKNGESAGTAGYGKRLEAIQIMLVKKGAAAPGATVKGITQTTSKSFNDANASGSTENPGNNQSSTKPSTDTSKPTWIAEQTVTVTYYQCDSCNNIYRTKEELEQHFAFWDPKYHVICSCGVNKAGTKRTETFTVRDGYWSNEQAPETRKVVWVATEPAYTETKEIVEMVPYDYCTTCGKRFYTGGIAEDGESSTEHTKKYALEEAMGIGKAHGSIRSYEEKERRVIGTETVTEPEYGHYQIQ